MKFDTVTIKDIAKALNLSTSTVSRALRGSYEISPETKKLVLEYAEKINYRPNPIALSLKERRSRSIGVVVSDVQHLASRSVDGLLISVSSETNDISHLKELHDKGLPIVFFDRITDEIDTDKITANNYLGAFHATEHLIFEGFKRIAHITSSHHLSITKERLRGYKEALEKHHVPFDEALVKHCSHGGMIAEEVELAVKSLFEGKLKPDAIFTASDRITTVCLRFMKEADAKKFDIGIIGFTNSNFGDLFSPALSVVRQPAFEIGQSATEMLIRIIESKRPITDFETKFLETTLIIRESSKKRV